MVQLPTPHEPPALSLVIPAFDASSVMARSLEEIREMVVVAAEATEVVVVDDASTDDTATVVESAAAVWPEGSTLRLLRHKHNRGKGAAVRTGMIAARGAHRLFTDADLAYGVDVIARMRAALDAGADIAVGVRGRHRGWMRRVAGWAFARAVSAYGLSAGPDPQCGIKAFTADAAGVLFGVGRVDGFAFDVEILHLASRWDLEIARVPVAERGGARHSSVSMLRDAPIMLRALGEIRDAAAAGDYEDAGPKPRHRKGLPTDV